MAYASKKQAAYNETKPLPKPKSGDSVVRAPRGVQRAGESKKRGRIPGGQGKNSGQGGQARTYFNNTYNEGQ
jgi:hypothetical protein